MANCLIGLGSNLGDRGATLQAALDQLRALPQTTFIAQSSFRDTRPAGGPVQDPYLNAAATIDTSLTPQQLLAELQRIENNLGRVRTEHWGPRTIDLDLLLYDRLELNSPELTLPHPRMSFRRFVLEPAAEIAAEMVYPINGWSMARLISHQRSTPREIGLVPTHSKYCRQSPATRLLKMLESETYLQQIFRRDVGVMQPTKQRLASWRSRKKATHSKSMLPPSATVLRRHANWLVSDFCDLQLMVEELDGVPEFDDLLAAKLRADNPMRLIVVWQPDDSPILPLLDRARHNPECPPVLWIPKVTLEQARLEVIAAMAAME